jgi:seryl-tRNA synthetase
MHDLRAVRDNVDELREAMRRRGKLDSLGATIDDLRSIDSERRTLIQAVEERKAARNFMSQEVAKRKRNGDNADEILAQSRALGEEIDRLERELAAQETALSTAMMEIPNATLPDVPEGDAEMNVVVRSWGEPRQAESVRPHWEVGTGLGLIDFERGAKIAGSGFILFRGLGATLVRALINMMLDLHTRQHGYEEVWVPALVNRAAMTGTGQLPKFEDDMYAVRDDDLFLIPTAEVPITNIYRDEIIPESDLPRAFAGYSPCFRREAGAHGKDTRGLIRVHEFDKVELVRYSTPERSPAELEILTGHAEKVLQLLGLPYRVVLLAAGDTGFSSAKTYDLEVFAPGAAVWLEVSSCSSFGDFQARRANIRYRPPQGGKPRFVHTLNGSGVAFPRLIAAILEHYQNADGTVAVPDALRPFVGADSLG